MRRNERATPKIQARVVEEHEIRPKLRFLMSEEAREEGKALVRALRCYTLSRPPAETKSQFNSLARGLREGRYPNAAKADEIMGGILTASLQKIADGFRQPEWLIWRSSWANALADGRPDLMEGAAMRMMERNERFVVSRVDDETAMLPTTTVDAVYAGGGFRGLATGGDVSVRDSRPVLDPAKLEEARTWYQDVFMCITSATNRRAAIRAFTPEQQKAHSEAFWDAMRLKDTAKVMISELERLTGEKFTSAWTTKDELHTALRAHFKACGYDEDLNLRLLRIGGY